MMPMKLITYEVRLDVGDGSWQPRTSVENTLECWIVKIAKWAQQHGYGAVVDYRIVSVVDINIDILKERGVEVEALSGCLSADGWEQAFGRSQVVPEHSIPDDEGTP